MIKTRQPAAFYKGPVSDHFDGERFFNPWSRMGKKRWRDFIKWRLFHERGLWPLSVENEPRNHAGLPHRPLRATYIGHATNLIQIQGLNALTDPVFSNRASPFAKMGPMRVRKPYLALEALPKIDIVFVSHNHYDHMDLLSLSWLAREHKPVFVTPLGNSRVMKAVTRDCAVIELDWHQTHNFENGLSITVTPSQHWSRRGVNDINRDLWGGAFMRDVEGQSLYFIGDSGFHQAVFEEIAARHGSPDIALIPIGAYEPRWFMQYAHMNPAEAIEVHKILRPKKGMGFHFETFRLTNEEFGAPRKDALIALEKAGLSEDDFLIPHPGDYVEI